METVWLIPVHVRPVVSCDKLIKGLREVPPSGLDRFNLTDIGDAFHGVFVENGAKVKFKNLDLPFPWEMVFKTDDGPQASLRGIKVGPSTYRSIFKLMFIDEPDNREIVMKAIDSLGRGPLDSPYWDADTWQLFLKQFKMSKANVEEANRKVLGDP